MRTTATFNTTRGPCANICLLRKHDGSLGRPGVSPFFLNNSRLSDPLRYLSPRIPCIHMRWILLKKDMCGSTPQEARRRRRGPEEARLCRRSRAISVSSWYAYGRRRTACILFSRHASCDLWVFTGRFGETIVHNTSTNDGRGCERGLVIGGAHCRLKPSRAAMCEVRRADAMVRQDVSGAGGEGARAEVGRRRH